MERRKSREHLKNMLMTALFAAMIYVVTSFVKIPTYQGYIHVGDGIMYLAAALLPMPYSIAAAAIGGGLADYLSGFAVWVMPTVLIKSAEAAMFTSGQSKTVNKHNMIAVILSSVVCVAGYWLAEGLIYGNFTAALAGIPTNFIQAVGSAALFLFIGLSLDKTDFRKIL